MQTPTRKDRRNRGFEKTSGLLASQIRKAGEARGFAVARLLTHWAEIVGTEIAALARPVKVGYGREGFGATLTLLCTGSAAPLIQMRLPEIRDKVNACYGREGFGATLTLLCTGSAAPLIQMRLPEIRDKVNACYGYAAIGQVKVTQTAAEGFAEPAAKFEPAPKSPRLEAVEAARHLADDVDDPGLRDALEALARNVMSKS